MSLIDPDKVKSLLVECAEEYVLPRYKQLADHEIDTKSGPGDLVTAADKDVEAALERALPELLPGSIVLGEEGISAGRHDVELLKDHTQKIWITDPIDGTYNFVHGRREFGIMLACIMDGQTQYGWIYDVLGEECAIAEKGAGAYFGDQKLQVQSRNLPQEQSGYFNPRYFPQEDRERLKEVAAQFKSCESLHCAAHEYLRIASGVGDFSLYNRMKPWDHLPGALILQEAGGYIAKMKGGEYVPHDDGPGLIAATSEENWGNIHEIFLGKSNKQ